MRANETYEIRNPRVVRELVVANPWATLVSNGDDGIVASHYPVLLDDSSEDLAVVTHLGRPDDQLHRFGRSEMLLIVSGPDGYISPSWYDEQAIGVPTWNFSVAHCYGVPEVLEAEENLRVLTRLVDHFEQHVDAPSSLDPAVGARLAGGTVGIRLAVTRFECKVKMSQGTHAVKSRCSMHCGVRAHTPTRRSPRRCSESSPLASALRVRRQAKLDLATDQVQS